MYYKILLQCIQKLYNLKIADRIYVLEDGQITEQGSFEELMHINGKFAALYQKQKL